MRKAMKKIPDWKQIDDHLQTKIISFQQRFGAAILFIIRSPTFKAPMNHAGGDRPLLI